MSGRPDDRKPARSGSDTGKATSTRGAKDAAQGRSATRGSGKSYRYNPSVK